MHFHFYKHFSFSAAGFTITTLNFIIQTIYVVPNLQNSFRCSHEDIRHLKAEIGDRKT